MDSLVCSRVSLSVPPHALRSLSAGRRAVRCSSALPFTATALLPAAAHNKKHCQLLYTTYTLYTIYTLWSVSGRLARLCKLHGSSALLFTAEALLPAAAHNKRDCQNDVHKRGCQLVYARGTVSWCTQERLSADVYNLQHEWQVACFAFLC